MRVVVDTNVFISAALKEKTPPETAVHIAAASHVLLKSTITERELFVTLDRPRLAPLIPSDFLHWLRAASQTREISRQSQLPRASDRLITACLVIGNSRSRRSRPFFHFTAPALFRAIGSAFQ
jgi:predicted nucleic acid-binding protein